MFRKQSGFKGSFRIGGYHTDKQQWAITPVWYTLQNRIASGHPRTARTEGNIYVVRGPLEAHPLMTARHITLPHLSKSPFNKMTNKDLTTYPYRMERRHQFKPEDYPRHKAFSRWFTNRQPGT